MLQLFLRLEKFITAFMCFNFLESLNDSWDFKSKRGSDIGEMDSSVFSVSHGDNGTPTPIMNLAGLSIYNVPKDNRTTGSLQKPIPIDRRWIIESGKIERRLVYFCWFFTYL